MTPHTDTDTLMRLRALKPDPLYLLLIMRVMGLMPPPNVVAADTQRIAANAGFKDTTTAGHLNQLLSMEYVGRLHYRAWYITANGLLLINPESPQKGLSACSSSSSNLLRDSSPSLLTTTTTAESPQKGLSADPSVLEMLVNKLLAEGCSTVKARAAIIAALGRGETPGQIAERIIAAKANAPKRRYSPVGYFIAAVILEGRAIEQRPTATAAEFDFSGYDTYTTNQPEPTATETPLPLSE